MSPPRSRRSDPMRARDSLIVAFATLAALAWLGAGASAHKPITSPFTFYEDVLPITARRSAEPATSPDGIAPMSLLSHESAVPWGESMRLELVAGHMPPWAAAVPSHLFRDTPAAVGARAERAADVGHRRDAAGRDTQGRRHPARPLRGHSAHRTRRWRCRR